MVTSQRALGSAVLPQLPLTLTNAVIVTAALAQGQTLAELAAEQGVESQAIIDALVADVAEKLNEAEADGRINADEADARLAAATDRITAFVNAGEPLRTLPPADRLEAFFAAMLVKTKDLR